MRRVSASLFSLPRQLNSFAELSKRNKVNYLSEGKTVVQFINHKIPNKLYLHSYNQLGFRLSNELFVYGPMALFPRFVLGWNIKDHTSINEDSLALFYLMVPKIDILIMGRIIIRSNYRKTSYHFLFSTRRCGRPLCHR